ncbi:response regulator [Azospirillum sp. sgz302134]
MASILLIDDDDLLSELLAMKLEVEGYAVVTAPDGAAGIARLRERRFDLVVLDLMMPVMDGLRTLDALAAEVPDPPPVIVLSASGGFDVASANGGARVAAVVRKPVESAELLARIAGALSVAG